MEDPPALANGGNIGGGTGGVQGGRAKVKTLRLLEALEVMFGSRLTMEMDKLARFYDHPIRCAGNCRPLQAIREVLETIQPLLIDPSASVSLEELLELRPRFFPARMLPPRDLVEEHSLLRGLSL